MTNISKGQSGSVETPASVLFPQVKDTIHRDELVLGGMMRMMRAHQGRIIADGRFVPDSVVKLPTDKRAIIIWEEDQDNAEKDRLSIQQLEVVRDVLAALKEIENEGFTSEDAESFERFDHGEYKLSFKERL